jgi:hypothetical protein
VPSHSLAAARHSLGSVPPGSLELNSLHAGFNSLFGRFNSLFGRFNFLFGRFNSLFGRFNSLFVRFNSLFGRLGNLPSARTKKQRVGDRGQAEKAAKTDFCQYFPIEMPTEAVTARNHRASCRHRFQ